MKLVAFHCPECEYDWESDERDNKCPMCGSPGAIFQDHSTKFHESAEDTGNINEESDSADIELPISETLEKSGVADRRTEIRPPDIRVDIERIYALKNLKINKYIINLLGHLQLDAESEEKIRFHISEEGKVLIIKGKRDNPIPWHRLTYNEQKEIWDSFTNLLDEVENIKNYKNLIISKKRVADHGEVYTGKREVNAMLDLVKHETERIESRFLEPACGTGNFLTEILERKLCIVKSRYGKSQLDYERYSVLAVSSVYGIDILEDNVVECRKRLFDIFDQNYTNLFKECMKEECRDAVKYILEKNIIWGNALNLKKIGKDSEPIVFSEWSPVNGSMFKRRDFAFHGLVDHAGIRTLPLFSDLGDNAFIPEPIKEYPLVHFLRIADAEKE